jgi:hypothetical protein
MNTLHWNSARKYPERTSKMIMEVSAADAVSDGAGNKRICFIRK